MKTISLPSRLVMLLLVCFSFTSAKAININNYGTAVSISLNSGDTLRILQGTYTGAVSNLPYGAVIVVSPNAVFAPSSIYFWLPAGKIINNGTSKFGTMGIGGGFNLENNNTVIVNGNMDLYSGTAKTILNAAGAKLTINGTLAASDHTTITNIGTLSTTGTMNLYTASSELTNKGLVSIGGDLNSTGIITNENLLRIAGNFNFTNGQVKNTGAISPTGTFSISSGMTYVNNCRLITKGGINVYGTLQNKGLVWAGTTNTSSDQLSIGSNGVFENGPNAKVRTVNFTNYGNITGAGFFYATGQTTLGSSATVGVFGVTTDSIRIYDVTRTNSTGIFDTQYGSIRPNTKYSVFAAPDSIEMYAGCSNTFKGISSGALPVKWNYFYVKLVRDQPVLYWGAEYEAGMKFEVQRSYNNTDYTVIHTLTSANSAAYTYTDATVNAGQPVVYYRIRGISAVDGEIKYTEIRTVKTGEKPKASLSVYPNPSAGQVAISYTAQSAEQVLIRIKSANGQQVSLKTANVVAGVNRVELAEARNLPAGIYFIDLIKGNEIIASEKMIRR